MKVKLKKVLKIKKCLKCREEFIPAHRTNFLCGICSKDIKKETELLACYSLYDLEAPNLTTE